MPISLDANMMRAIIMDHYQNPQHKKTPKSGYLSIHSKSENCIDDINVYLKVNKGIVVDALWDGIACTISTASTDILCELVIKKKEADAKKIIREYFKMIKEEKFDEDLLGEAIAFINTAKQAARIKCATIGAHALEDLLDHKHEKK
ncbi:MAG: SUF system NifU family Fe-S cluster assembly protein [Bacilli bacterium]|nr:SUF system NifU family Fe-S cluster assembly protein [Bacilli bacterium]